MITEIQAWALRLGHRRCHFYCASEPPSDTCHSGRVSLRDSEPIGRGTTILECCLAVSYRVNVHLLYDPENPS